MYKHQIWWFLLAAFAGTTLFYLLPFSQVNVLVINSVYLGVLVFSVLTSVIWRLPAIVLVILQSLTVFLCGFLWAKEAKLTMLSTTNVINTELILNSCSIVLGFLLIALTKISATINTSTLNHKARAALSVLLLLLAGLPLSGEIILACMKLGILGLDKGLLSYVSKVTNFSWLLSYVVLALASLCLIKFFTTQVRPLKRQVQLAQSAIERRKHQAALNAAQRKVRFNIATIATVLVALLFWDLVASQPIRRSEAQRIEIAADQAVHIPITEQLVDGKLHRFEWIASDGKVVRFFIIDRFAGEQKFGVVFDSCMLCGDAGYAQVGDQVVCLACGVHIFIPSIGKPGGCNPIPIPKWDIANQEILITKATLESGLKYFSDVVEVMATDPVNGKQISNMDAEHSYLFSGKTYFFTSEQSYDAFRDDPWKYADVEPLNPLGE
ncbi:Fe-S-containing protein [Vibrio panuliri]|uniref:Fe-S-containing protein n=1 Tax=Vibrio panuliri TaxID=1381081 RepID=UPI001CE25312|nr:Fe-S-containing protein [Vibrio panuliri]